MPLSDFGLPSDLLLWPAVLLAALSFLIGILGGLIGLALGTIRLPLMLLMGIPAGPAGSTSILLSCLTAITGSYRHLRDGRVKPRIVLAMGLPAMAGAFIGGLFSRWAPENLLVGLVGALILWQGVEFTLLAWRRMRRRNDAAASDDLDGAPGRYTAARIAGVAGIGGAIGILGGAIGLVLGAIRLPLLIRILRVDPRLAAGSNLFIGMAMGALGWIGHLLNGRLDWTLVALLGSTAIIGSYLGARLTGRINLNILILLMGLALLCAGLLLLWRGASSL